MTQGYRQFISIGAIVLAAAIVVTWCRAQDEGDPSVSSFVNESAAQFTDSFDEGFSPLVVLGDLKVHSVSAPASASRGASIWVSDVTTNIGGLSVLQSQSDMYICTSVNNVSVSCMVSNHTTAGIAKNKSWPWGGYITVPASQPLGTNYYIVVANGNRQVGEANYYNNTNYVMIIINP